MRGGESLKPSGATICLIVDSLRTGLLPYLFWQPSSYTGVLFPVDLSACEIGTWSRVQKHKKTENSAISVISKLFTELGLIVGALEDQDQQHILDNIASKQIKKERNMSRYSNFEGKKPIFDLLKYLARKNKSKKVFNVMKTLRRGTFLFDI